MIDEKILIEKIQNHSKSVGDGITNPFMKAGYKLAHEHIVDIIHLLQTQSTQPISAGTINCGHIMHPVIPPLRPVVLCKECMFYFPPFCNRPKNRMNHSHALMPNDFCSYGKRKD